jgi:hypothetical protein
VADLITHLQQPVSAWWAVGLALATPILTIAGFVYGARRAERRDQARHDEWVRQFEAGEVQ